MAKKKPVSVAGMIGEAISDVVDAASVAATGSQLGVLELAAEEEMRPAAPKRKKKAKAARKKSKAKASSKKTKAKKTKAKKSKTKASKAKKSKAKASKKARGAKR
jgi:predicted lipid-binding transport protein (Tim44 family)